MLRRIKIRLSHWEYWSSTLLYLPLMPYLLYRFIRAGSMFVFNSTNPGIENGGFTMESKWKIQQGKVKRFFPETIYCRKGESACSDSLTFPVYVKPDIGGKGRGVVVVESKEELLSYATVCPVDYLIQEKVNFPKEVGVFYVRFPWEKTGFISGIVSKEFMSIVGDGYSTVEELIDQNDRYYLQKEVVYGLLSTETLKSIPLSGERIPMPEIGNHARGCRFYNESHHISQLLTETIHNIATEFDGFYFGRFDIRFNSWSELEKGENFKIIEVNGSGSEPTHIYDATQSLLYAWKEIIRHWDYLFVISKYNKEKGIDYFSIKKGISLLMDHFRTMKALERLRFER